MPDWVRPRAVDVGVADLGALADQATGRAPRHSRSTSCTQSMPKDNRFYDLIFYFSFRVFDHSTSQRFHFHIHASTSVATNRAL